MLNKGEAARAEGLLWVSSIAMNCFIVSMSIESSVDSVLEAGARVGAGGCGQSHARAEASVL